MLIRFCLYGFLKNQRYFEPFFVLALLEKGLDFTMIGLLIGFREAIVLALEIPSGAIADVCGRRRAMMLSFSAYVVSFLLFAYADQLGLLIAAMAAFAIGEVFRSGTHKAMIFTWLRLQGRTDERPKIYGSPLFWLLGVAFAFGAAGHASLRFNWRGVGASGGTPSGEIRCLRANKSAVSVQTANSVPRTCHELSPRPRSTGG